MKETKMQARMTNPVFLVPEAMQAMLAFAKAGQQGGVPLRTLELVNLRASQINGCSVCVEMHAADLKKGGDTDARIITVSAWRESPHFTDAERAALALAEAGTRLADRPEAVSDEIWDEAARHYDEAGLASLVLAIAGINVWNRLNAMTRQIAGQWKPANVAKTA
jgi:AhpD family alkylhydroperoxidase